MYFCIFRIHQFERSGFVINNDFIGKITFEFCGALEDIILIGNIITIGDRVFLNYYVLEEIELPSSLTTIDNTTFKYCTSLTWIILLPKVQTIGDYKCSEYAGLKWVILLEWYKHIPEGILFEAIALQHIAI